MPWDLYSAIGVVMIGITSTSSCSTSVDTTSKAAEGKDYAVYAKPNDQESRFEVEISALTSTAICIPSQDWPLPNGQWVGQAGLFEAIADGRKLSPPDENPGSCAGPGCILRIEGNSRIRAFLNYAVFNDGGAIASSTEKSLMYNISPSLCD